MIVDLLKGSLQLLPLLVLFAFSLIILSLKIFNKNKEPAPVLVFTLASLSLVLSLLLLLLLGFNDGEVLSLKFDHYGTGASVLVALASLQSLFLLFSNRFIDKSQMSEIVFLFLNGILSLYVFCLGKDLMTAFIGLELASLVLYIMISMSRENTRSLEASVKYFILSSFSGIVFLYGLSFLFGTKGDLSFSVLMEQTEALSQFNRFFYLGLALIFVSLFFKMALFPFQFWLADVYAGAITPVTVFMATAIKSAVVLFLAKLFSFPFFALGEQSLFVYGLGFLSVLTALFGSLMALKERKLKRLVAFSSLAHSGYLMMAMISVLILPFFDFTVLFYYLLAYIFMTGGLLTGVQCLEEKTLEPTLDDLKGSFSANPFFAILVMCFLLSLAGVPPFFGFFAKVALLKVLILSQNWWLVFWAFVASAFGLYYYMKPITFMMQKDENFSLQVSKSMKASLGFSLILTVFGGFFFGIFL